MVRAAATGVVDYSAFDPDDNWWWRRHRWLLQEMEDSDSRKVAETHHQHWLAVMTVPGLKEESFEAARVNAATHRNQVMKLAFPWLADRIGEEGERTSEQELAAVYEAEFGKPGEPKYEQMVENLKKSIEEIHKKTRRRRK